MRVPALTLLAALLAIPGVSDGQGRPTDSTLAGNAAARAVLVRALDAMGGVTRLEGIGATRRRFVFATRDRGQGSRPTSPGDPGPVIETGHGEWIHDPATRRAQVDEAGTIFGGQPYARRRRLSPAGGYLAQDSTRRVDSLSSAATAAMLASLERQLPETVLAQAWAQRHRMQMLSDAGNEARLAFATDDARMLVLVFDRASGLLLRQEQLQDHPALGDYAHRIRYEDWRSVGEIRLPFRHVEESVTGVRVRTMREVSVGMPAPTDSGPPAGYLGAPEAARESMLAPGVHFLPGAYNALLVEFDDFFVAVEPAPGTRAARRVLERAAQLAPAKPVRFVVITHFHDDHLGGIRPFIAAGSTVLTTAHGAESVREIAAVRKGMYPDTLDALPRAPIVEPVSGRRVIEDATQRLEVLDIGRSPHAEQMLVVWLPNARAIYEADLLDLDVPLDGIAMPGADTRHFAEWLARRRLPVDIIIPTHGRIGRMRDLERAVSERAPSHIRR